MLTGKFTGIPVILLRADNLLGVADKEASTLARAGPDEHAIARARAVGHLKRWPFHHERFTTVESQRVV